MQSSQLTGFSFQDSLEEKENDFSLKRSLFSRFDEDEEEPCKRVLLEPSPDPDARQIKTTDDEFISIPPMKLETFQIPSYRSLLSTPIHRLMQQANESTFEQETTELIQHEAELWVDKYSPKYYVDLLGDERVHRQILSWVKQWDTCVFQKQRPKTQDKLFRPDARLLLLHGGPGVGKTSIAHVVARHCGYNVLEINASDDRGGEGIQNKVLNAIQSKSFGKPNLIVIDEIDGVYDHAFIRFLCKIASGAINSYLPIICICNELYVPTLKPLRSAVKPLQLVPPAYQLLAKRLGDICQRERLKSDLRTLMALVERCQGDVRACINTLQMLKQKTKTLTFDMILDLNSKDTSPSLPKVWESLFKLPKAKSKEKYVDKLNLMIESFGDTNIVMNACFETYPKCKMIDKALSSKIFPFILDYDRFNRAGLVHYANYSLIHFYRLYASPQIAFHFEFPRSDINAFSLQKTNSSIVKSFMDHVPLSLNVCLLDFIPFLLQIIFVDFRPTTILKASDKWTLNRLVQLFISYHISFEESMDPPIDQIFGSWKFSDSAKMLLSKTLKQASIVLESQPTLERKDFFGRMVTLEQTTVEKNLTVLFKFNEGFSNAVRKPVLMKDWL